MTEKNGAIYFTDMSKCLPESALCKDPTHGCWRKCDYELYDGLKGVMLFATPEDEAGEITLPLNLEGEYKIFIGMNFTRGSLLQNEGQLFARLSDEEGFTPFIKEELDSRVNAVYKRFNIEPYKTEADDTFTSIYEIFWKVADVGEKSIVFKPPYPPFNDDKVISNISYVKLQPLTPEEKEGYDKISANKNKKCINLMYCCAKFSGSTKGGKMFHAKDRQLFTNIVAPLRNSDVESLSFECIRGNICLFKTKIGDTGFGDTRWEPDWVDPLEAMTEECHKNGIEIYPALRMISAWYPVYTGPMNRAKFYWEHPEFRKKDKQGRDTSSLSIACPEVRNFWLGMLGETLNYGVDGIHIYMNRCHPFVLYEDKSVEDFKNRFGVDPREIDLNDAEWAEKWYEHITSYTTQLIREARKMLDDYKPGLKLVVTINSAKLNSKDPELINKYSFDVDTWIKEGLVDIIIPSNKIEGHFIKHWNELSGGKVKIYPDLLPRTLPRDLSIKIMNEYYKAGATGFSMWDAERRITRTSEWAVIKHLGHTEDFEFLTEQCKDYWTFKEIEYLNGMNTKYSFHDG